MSSADGTSGWSVGVPVGVFGAALASAHAVHAIDEVGRNILAAFYGSLLPFAVAVGVGIAGLRIGRRKWDDVSPWRLAGWCGAGAVVTLLLAVLLIQYQISEGVVPEDRTFVALMFVTYGAGIGLLVGEYDVRIRETQARLAEETRRLDEFASIVSHDLRNPLNVAQGYVELVAKTGDTTELDHVVDAHERMETILTDMLTLAKEGDRTVSLTPVSIAAVAEEAWAMVTTGDATLRVTADVTLHADRGRLQTLFENLFRNAVEHGSTNSRPEADDAVESTSSRTHEATPVDVTVATLDDGSGFYVEDTGRGIPPAHRERVFEAAFTTGDGSGIGLAIVRAAADAHGWSHTITEGEHGGARFEFRQVSFADDDRRR